MPMMAIWICPSGGKKRSAQPSHLELICEMRVCRTHDDARKHDVASQFDAVERGRAPCDGSPHALNEDAYDVGREEDDRPRSGLDVGVLDAAVRGEIRRGGSSHEQRGRGRRTQSC